MNSKLKMCALILPTESKTTIQWYLLLTAYSLSDGFSEPIQKKMEISTFFPAHFWWAATNWMPRIKWNKSKKYKEKESTKKSNSTVEMEAKQVIAKSIM